MDEQQISALADQLESSLDRIRRARFGMAEKSGLRGPERFVLLLVASLRDGEPVMPSELARHMGITSAAITHHLNSLDEKGMLLRVSSEDDRRVSLVTLSDEGRSMVEQFRQAMRTRTKELVSYLGESDASALASLLTKIATYMSIPREERP